MAAPEVRLRDGRDRSLRRRHPWVFSGAVTSTKGKPQAGDVVAVVDQRGEFVAWAGYSPQSQIVGRVWSFDQRATVDDAFVAAQVQAAAERRIRIASNGVRLTFAESDWLPGVIADRYADHVVMQVNTAAAEPFRHAIADALAVLPGVVGVSERLDGDARKREGLDARDPTVRGTPPAGLIEIEEAAGRFLVDVHRGHKTGFYLDQRDARATVGSASHGRDVLNLFSYTGGFSIAAQRGGAARVVNVDSSQPALDMIARHESLNDCPSSECVNADVFSYLRTLRDRGDSFDLVVVDPPKLAPTAAQANKATRAYKDANLWAIRLLNSGGLLATFSCSGGIDAALFQKVVAGAAADAGRDVEIIGSFGQPADHPVLLSFPESAYLKGLLCRVQ